MQSNLVSTFNQRENICALELFAQTVARTHKPHRYVIGSPYAGPFENVCSRLQCTSWKIIECEGDDRSIVFQGDYAPVESAQHGVAAPSKN